MQDEQPDRTVNADERLLDVADSVASGSDVDWAFASTAHAGDDLELLEQLKLIDAVARLHRGRRRCAAAGGSLGCAGTGGAVGTARRGPSRERRNVRRRLPRARHGARPRCRPEAPAPARPRRGGGVAVPRRRAAARARRASQRHHRLRRGVGRGSCRLVDGVHPWAHARGRPQAARCVFGARSDVHRARPVPRPRGGSRNRARASRRQGRQRDARTRRPDRPDGLRRRRRPRDQGRRRADGGNAALSRAGDFRRPSGNRPERSLQPRRAALPAGDRRLSGQWGDAGGVGGCPSRRPLRAAARCASESSRRIRARRRAGALAVAGEPVRERRRDGTGAGGLAGWNRRCGCTTGCGRGRCTGGCASPSLPARHRRVRAGRWPCRLSQPHSS